MLKLNQKTHILKESSTPLQEDIKDINNIENKRDIVLKNKPDLSDIKGEIRQTEVDI